MLVVQYVVSFAVVLCQSLVGAADLQSVVAVLYVLQHDVPSVFLEDVPHKVDLKWASDLCLEDVPHLAGTVAQSL